MLLLNKEPYIKSSGSHLNKVSTVMWVKAVSACTGDEWNLEIIHSCHRSN